MDLFLDWLFADKLRTGLISCITAFLWIKIKERKEYVSLLASLVRISKETLHFHAQKTFVSIQHTLRNDKKHRVFSSTSSILIHKIILFFLSSRSFSRRRIREVLAARVSAARYSSRSSVCREPRSLHFASSFHDFLGWKSSRLHERIVARCDSPLN